MDRHGLWRTNEFRLSTQTAYNNSSLHSLQRRLSIRDNAFPPPPAPTPPRPRPAMLPPARGPRVRCVVFTMPMLLQRIQPSPRAITTIIRLHLPLPVQKSGASLPDTTGAAAASLFLSNYTPVAGLKSRTVAKAEISAQL